MRITTFIGVEGLSAIRTSRELTPQAPRTARRPQHCWALCTPPTASACLAPLVHCGRPRTPCQAAGGLFFKAVVCSLARPAPRTSGQLGPHLVSPTPDPHLTPEPRKPSPAPDKKCKHMALPASVKKKKLVKNRQGVRPGPQASGAVALGSSQAEPRLRPYCCVRGWTPVARSVGVRQEKCRRGCPAGSNCQLYQCSIYFKIKLN